MTESGFNWGLLGQQAGLGLVLGLSVGYSLKKALKVALILVGALTALLVGLSRIGFITVHWDVIESAYTSAMQQAGGARGALDRVVAWFSSSLAVAGSFSLGFWLGFRKG
ncbi:MAG: FUN14 domain-containing protein [Limnochordaceae bacterium]|nr:FUN14 domain-containing protein [Limnochordaceae bacterium]